MPKFSALTITCASVRLLLPFHFSVAPKHVDSLIEAACKSDSASKFWQGIEVSETTFRIAHSAYMLEFHEHVRKFLFDGRGDCGCRYLCFSGLQSPQPENPAASG